jgi:hypothetical protein
MSEKPNTTTDSYDGPLSGFFDAIIETGINVDASEPSQPTPAALARFVKTEMGERGLTVGDSTEKVSRLQSDLGTTNGALESLNEGEKNNSKEIGELNAVLKSKKDAIKNSNLN